MRAVLHDRYGGPEILRLGEAAEPIPRRGEVLVRVLAAGVDPGVRHLIEGRPAMIRLATGLRRPRRRVPGIAFAGTVEALGRDAEGLRIGDEIYGTATSGSFAEFATARVDKVAPKPGSLDFAAAAAVPISAVTALQAIRDGARVRPGQRVLVLGAAGGVGGYAVQLAKAAGAEVVGAASAAKLPLVRELAADAAVDYATTDPLGLGPFDAIIDTAGTRPLAALRRAISRDGAVVLVGGEQGGLGMLLSAPLRSALSRQRLVGLISIERRADLIDLAARIDAGELRPPIDRVLPLERAAEALEAIGRGHGTGKTVLRIDA